MFCTIKLRKGWSGVTGKIQMRRWLYEINFSDRHFFNNSRCCCSLDLSWWKLVHTRLLLRSVSDTKPLGIVAFKLVLLACQSYLIQL